MEYWLWEQIDADTFDLDGVYPTEDAARFAMAWLVFRKGATTIARVTACKRS